jgi:hypothetical protein
MNREQYLEYHRLLCDEARKLSERKNHDYAGKGGEQPFANFQRCEALGICSTERGFLVRMTDKMSRLASFCDAGKFAVADEKVRDTCIDLINYTALLLAYIDSRTNATVVSASGQVDDPYEYTGE